jgi:hypothetical protein
MRNAWLIFDTPFFANFGHIQKYTTKFEHWSVFYKYGTVIYQNLS